MRRQAGAPNGRARNWIPLVLCAAATVTQVVVAQTPSSPTGTAALLLPTRRVPDAPPSAPPDVPASLQRAEPLTVTAVLDQRPRNGARAQTLRQKITRTAGRIHVARSDGREWLFEQNPVDPRRVSGLLIEHSARAVVRYEESDLRLAFGIRGWADVMCLGFDPEVLPRLTRTGRSRNVSGIVFAHYADENGKSEGVWWSQKHGLATGVTTGDANASMTFSIERVSASVDEVVLTAPSARFPKYRVVDLAEWLEHR